MSDDLHLFTEDGTELSAAAAEALEKAGLA